MHKYIVNYDGKIYIKLTPENFRKIILFLISMVFTSLILKIIKHYNVNNITIMCDNIYSRVIAQCYLKNNIKFTLCKNNNVNLYYDVDNSLTNPTDLSNNRVKPHCLDLTSQGKSEQSRKDCLTNPTDLSNNRVKPHCLQIPFNYSHYSSFLPMSSVKMMNNKTTLIPNTSLYMSNLENHTDLSNLMNIQNYILTTLDSQIDISDIIYSKSADNNPIISVKKFFANYYYITTNNNIWISKFLLNDKPTPLIPNDIIISINAKINPTNSIDLSNNLVKPLIQIKNDTCKVIDEHTTTILYNSSYYIVNNDNSITKSESFDNDNIESKIYSLKTPRPFKTDNCYMIHPFHIPFTWDTFLTLMTIGLGILN